MSAQQLFRVQTLKSLVVDSTDGIAVGEHCVTVAVHISTQNRGVAKPTCAQEQGAAGNLRIFFLTAEPVQERHDA